MDDIRFKAVCKEMAGGASVSEVTFSGANEVAFDSSSIPAHITVTAADVDSGSAASGKVLTADGLGGALWESVGEAQQNIINLSASSGTLTDDQLEQAQEAICFIKLADGGNEYVFRKYLETSSMIYFTLVSEGDVSGGSAQINRNHIDVTVSTKAYALAEGELIDTYNKSQIDSAFTEVNIQEE